MAFMQHGLWVVLLWSRGPVGGSDDTAPVSPQDSPTVAFGIYWPPQDPALAGGAKTRALLTGRVTVRVQNEAASGCTASLRLTLTRPSDEPSRQFWNSRLAFPEYDWMSYVRVWDAEQRWLWPNLAYLLRLHGKERVERYGGVDPGKGVDNDFAAVLIRKHDATGQGESDATKKEPLVSAEWHPIGATAVDKQTVVHEVESDEFTLHLGKLGEEHHGRAGIWLIYADFLGARPPPAWPKEPEYAGGILAYFELRWTVKADGGHDLKIEQLTPQRSTRFDWERWTSRTRTSPDSKRTAKLSDRRREHQGPSNQSPPTPAGTNRPSSADGSRRE
jgi:hypothetical protein